MSADGARSEQCKCSTAACCWLRCQARPGSLVAPAPAPLASQPSGLGADLMQLPESLVAHRYVVSYSSLAL